MHIDIRYPVPAIGAIALKDDEILLVKRAVEPSIGKWSIPGGSVEIGETLQEAVKREVREETGLEVEVGDLAGVTDLIVRTDGALKWHYVLINFMASVTGGALAAASDVSDCRWVRLSEIRNYDVTVTLLRRLEEMGLISK